MRLGELVETSGRIAATSGRLEKIEHLAGLLRRLRPDEVEIAVGFLSGAPRQGRLGAGWAVISQSRQTAPAAAPSLLLVEQPYLLPQTFFQPYPDDLLDVEAIKASNVGDLWK